MATKKPAPARAETMTNRMTLYEARVEERCLCQGCLNCRGQSGYPCGALSEARCGGVERERCRWCR